MGSWGGPRPGAGAKPKAVRPHVVKPNPRVRPAQTQPAPRIKISDDAMLRARSRPILGTAPKNIFQAPSFPPGARGEKTAGGPMAFDEQVANVASWAWGAGGFETAASEWAIGFLGYAYLSELANRAEYRLITETLSTEMTRKWIKLTSAGNEDKTDKLKELKAEMERLQVEPVFKKAATQDGYFGRAHIHIDTGHDGEELKEPIGDGSNDVTKAKISKGSIKRLINVEPIWCYPTNYNSSDPTDPRWYNPNAWIVMSKTMHSTRLLTFIGREVPDILKPAFAFGGLSMTQMAKPYVDYWLKTRTSVGEIVQSFSVFVLKTVLGDALELGADEMFRRVDLFNLMRNNRGTFVVDKETEDFANVSAPLGTLDSLQSQSQEHMASVARIPIVKLFGIQPAGLNASSEGEIRVFYDNVHAWQKHLFDANLKKVIAFAQMNIWGVVDPDIGYEWEPLFALTEKEEAEVRKTDAETGQILINDGTIHPAEERQRVAADPGTPYQGLDVEDVPDLAEEEEEGLDPTAGPGGGGGEGGGEADGGFGAGDRSMEAGGDEDAPFPFASDEFREADHPRGQPSNAGQFGPGGGSSSSGASRAEQGKLGPGGGAGSRGPRGRKGAAAAAQHAKSLGYPMKVYSDPKSSYAAAWSQGELHINEAHKFWRDPAEAMRRLHASGQLSSADPNHVVNHEIGHAKFDAPDNFMTLGHQQLAREKVSKYAAMNPKEFVSEVYAGMKAGREFPPDVMQAFKSYAKPREGESVVRSTPEASTLYQAPSKTAEQIVSEFPGAADAIKNTVARIKAGTPSDALVSEGGFKSEDGSYVPERAAAHSKIVDKFFSDEAVMRALPAEGEKPTFTMLGGRGGSGKSWLTKAGSGPVDSSKCIVVDCDAIKEQLPGYEGWNAALFHEESSDVIEMVLHRSRALGINLVLDATLKSEAGSIARMTIFAQAGYNIEGYYMYASPEVAATRAMSRFSKGGTFKGRFVPPEIILSNTQNESNFDKISPAMKKWAVYDNNEAGTPDPRLVSKSQG